MKPKIIFLFFLIPQLIYSQTLEEMIQWSFESNTGLKATETKPQKAFAKAQGMQSLEAPTLSTEWMNQTAFSPMEFKITAQQMLPWPGKRKAIVDLENSMALESKALLPMQKWELQREVVRAYVDLWYAQEMKKIKKSQARTWDLAEQNLHLALQNGKAKSSEMLQLAQAKSALQRDSISVVLEILQMKSELASLIGKEIKGDFIAEEIKQTHFPALDSTQMHIQLGMYEAQNKILSQKEKSIKAEYQPDLMVGVSYQKNWMQKDAYGVMVGMSLPMAPWVQSQNARSQEIQIDKRLVELQKKETQRKFELEWQMAKNQDSLWNLQKQDLEQKSLPQSSEIRKMLLSELSTGMADFREIAEALRMENELHEQVLQLKMQIQMNRAFWDLKGLEK